MLRRVNCVVCDTELQGKQRQFCSNKCRKWYDRAKAKDKVKELAKEVAVQVQVEREPAPSVAKAVQSDDPLVMLKALQVRIAVEIDVAEHPKDLAVLATKFMDALEKIEQRTTPVVKEASAFDELNKRRAARRGAGAELSV